MATNALSGEIIMIIQYVQDKLKISQAMIARRADVAQGTVSNCMRGVAIRSDYLTQIVDGVIPLAEEALINSRLADGIVSEIRAQLKLLATFSQAPAADDSMIFAMRSIRATVIAAALATAKAAIIAAEAAAAEAVATAAIATNNPTAETVTAANNAIAVAKSAAAAAIAAVAETGKRI